MTLALAVHDGPQGHREGALDVGADTEAGPRMHVRGLGLGGGLSGLWCHRRDLPFRKIESGELPRVALRRLSRSRP